MLNTITPQENAKQNHNKVPLHTHKIAGCEWAVTGSGFGFLFRAMKTVFGI